MAYLFLLTGVVLMVAGLLPALKVVLATPLNRAEPEGGEAPAGAEDLAAHLAALQAEIADLKARLAAPASGSGETPAGGQAFPAYLAKALAGEGGVAPAPAAAGVATGGQAAAGEVTEAGAGAGEKPAGQLPAASPAATDPARAPGDVREQIRLAHAAGEGIDSLARRFGRGKGEIALILNLRR
ncbi:MAG: hypothetical protein PWQ18_793 [Clostridia bacterium]|nr:hypothetical protein [Clostridia bacterium]